MPECVHVTGSRPFLLVFNNTTNLAMHTCLCLKCYEAKQLVNHSVAESNSHKTWSLRGKCLSHARTWSLIANVFPLRQNLSYLHCKYTRSMAGTFTYSTCSASCSLSLIFLTLPEITCPHHRPRGKPLQWASVQVGETLMSHQKNSDSPLMKLEQYLFSYSHAAAPRHPAGKRICEMGKT